jgi:hypothetical protein
VTSNPGGITYTGTSSPIVVTGLTNGTSYTFTMTATNIMGTGLSSSPPSNSVTPRTVPGSIGSLSASAGDKEVGLFWSAPSSNGGSEIIDYIIEYKLSSDSNWSVFADPVSNNTSAIVTGLVNNLSYDFRVSAVNSIGQGSFNSNPFSTLTSQTEDSVNRRKYSSATKSPIITNTTDLNINTDIVDKNINTKLDTLPLKKTDNNISNKTKKEINLPIESLNAINKNEVSVTPTENSKIKEPIIEKKIKQDDFEKEKKPNQAIKIIAISVSLIVLVRFLIFIFLHV